jgi:CO/xanthine dehydrogenase Mo-binding subunit
MRGRAHPVSRSLLLLTLAALVFHLPERRRADLQGGRHIQGVRAHEHHVGGLDGHVGASRDRDPEIGLSQGRRVVHAVPDHRRHPESPRAVGDRRPVESAPGAGRKGAVFAEISVDPDLGSVRVRRLVGAWDIGRVLNPRLARGQAIGA